MDYKERYEKALECAKLGMSVEEIFPELRESEDEKIRKAISYAIAQSTHSDGTLINGVNQEDAIAWLEKQKDIVPVVVPEQEWDCQMAYSEGYRKGMESVKPAEWSEEDERHRQWILECLADGARKVPEYAEQYQSAFNWLKSLPYQTSFNLGELVNGSEGGIAEEIKSCIEDCYEKGYITIRDLNSYESWLTLYKDFELELEKAYKNRDEVVYRRGYEDGVKSVRCDCEGDSEDLLSRFAFYTYKDEPEVVYVANVFVDEEYRGKGVGRRILDAVESAAVRIGAKFIRLKVECGSKACKWYFRNGYEHCGGYGDEYYWLEKDVSTHTLFKPSEEQIKVLEDVLDENDLYQYQRIGMRELVEELKKLV